jgi:hypothetical protein
MKPAEQKRKQTMSTNKKPAYEVFAIREGKNNKSYFVKIGAVWPAKNGNGLHLDLVAFPVNGRAYLAPPKATQEPAPETTVDDNGPYIEDEMPF